jgi:5'-AMP-activated protein kinase catalytic alpha subunit
MESKKSLYIVMEYCERGELFDYIVKLGKIEEKEACRKFQQIINGVEYLHNKNIIHRDLNKGKVTGLE